LCPCPRRHTPPATPHERCCHGHGRVKTEKGAWPKTKASSHPGFHDKRSHVCLFCPTATPAISFGLFFSFPPRGFQNDDADRNTFTRSYGHGGCCRSPKPFDLCEVGTPWPRYGTETVFPILCFIVSGSFARTSNQGKTSQVERCVRNRK